MLLFGGGVAVQAGYGGWRSWRKRERQAAVGAFFLAAATVAMMTWLAVRSE